MKTPMSSGVMSWRTAASVYAVPGCTDTVLLTFGGSVDPAGRMETT